MSPTLRSLPVIGTIVLLIALVACGPGSGTDDQAAETAAQAATDPAAEDASWFDRLVRPQPVDKTLPAGTLIPVRFNETLSSHDSTSGQPFSAQVTQDVAVDGVVVVPAGATVTGSVSEASVPRKVGGRARLSLSFERLQLADGQTVPISAAFAGAGRSEAPKDAAIIGGSTLGGVVLGEAVDKGEGGIVGGVVGAIAGTVAAVKTKGKPVVLPAGTVMSLELNAPATITVEQ